MMISISSLVSDLRSLHVLGRAEDKTVASLIYSGSDTLLLHYCCGSFAFWSILRRTSLQHYTVLTLFSYLGEKWSKKVYFRNSRLTAEYINILIHKGGSFYEN